MAKRQPITVNGESFKTKKELQDRVRGILYSCPEGVRVDDADAAFLLDLLNRHPSAAEKMGPGVSHFTTQRTEWGNVGFVLVRVDGSSTDFSYIHCITPKSPLADVKRAFRAAVFEQVQAFKKNVFFKTGSSDGLVARVLCPVTSEEIFLDDCHVDHEPPLTFEKLFADFVSLAHLDPEKIEVTGFGDNEMEKHIADENLRQTWAEYHQRHARLRVVSQRANLSEIKKQGNKSK